MSKPILCLDFDGVCHSYTSGWQGADNIPDPPVEGLFEFLYEANEYFIINIFSGRSHRDGGIEAMKKWFQEEWLKWIRKTEYTGINIVPWLRFPDHKPPALLTLDDRAMLFVGKWPNVWTMHLFQPWYKKETKDD